MKRKIVIGGVALIAAALALFWIFVTTIGHMMEPFGGGIGDVLRACAIAVVLITIVVLVLLSLGRMNAYVLAVAVAFMAVAAFTPEQVYSVRRQAYVAKMQAEEQAREAKRVAELESRKQGIDARIDAKRPYTPEESLNFLFFVSASDLRHQNLSDHSEAALLLLRRALQEKVIDPNGWVQGPPVADVAPEPLFLHYYKFWARPLRRGPVDAMQWKIMRVVAENGADLTMPAAAGLVEDLSKPERPGVTRHWVELD